MVWGKQVNTHSFGEGSSVFHKTDLVESTGTFRTTEETIGIYVDYENNSRVVG